MARYRITKDENGNVSMIWFKNAKKIIRDARESGKSRHALLRALAIELRLSKDTYAAILTGEYRIIYDSSQPKRGCYVMFGSGSVIENMLLRNSPENVIYPLKGIP